MHRGSTHPIAVAGVEKLLDLCLTHDFVAVGECLPHLHLIEAASSKSISSQSRGPFKATIAYVPVPSRSRLSKYWRK